MSRLFARRLTRFSLAASLFAAYGAVPLQASTPSSPVTLVDRERGEDEQIRARLEWFLKHRRAGLGDGREMARLRLDAARELAWQIRDQRVLRRDGLADVNNFWEPVGPSASHFGGWAFGDISGRVTGIAKGSDGVLWLATAAGGAWKSTNDGLSWTQLIADVGTQATGAIAVDPNASGTIWLGTGDYNSGCEGYFGIGMLRSTDAGASWQLRNGTGGTTLDAIGSFSSIIVDPRNSSHVVAAADMRNCSGGAGGSGGIFRTLDGGATWSERLNGVEVYELAQNDQNRDIWWAATNQGIYRSTDNAVTWAKQTGSGLPTSGTGRTELAIAPSNGNFVYALFADGAAGSSPEFWRTTNGGTSWTKMSSDGSACDGQCFYNMTLRVHKTQPDTVYRGTVLLFKSTNGGSTWTQLISGWGGSQEVHQDIQELMIDPSVPDGFYVGSDGGLWKSTDGGDTFVSLNSNLHTFLFYQIGMHPTDPGVVCGGAQDNSSLARTTSNVWDLQAVTGDGFVCHINPQNPNIAYIASYPSGGPSISRSQTGVLGSFGGIDETGINSSDRWNWVTPYILDPVTPSTVYLGSHRMYKSLNHGDGWTQVGPVDMTGGSGTVYSLEVNRNFPNVVYAGTESGRVWRSTDFGATWTDITVGLPARAINDIGADPTNPGRAFATLSGFNTDHVWEWNEGQGWVSRSAGLPNLPTNTVLMLTGQDLFVGNDIAVYRSTDGGLSYAPFMDGLPEGIVATDLKYVQSMNRMTLGSYGRGAWQVSLDPVAANLVFESIELPLTQVDGDGDGNVEPGETWSVTPRLRNLGGQAASAVTARLRTATPQVTINAPNQRSFGDLAPGAIGAATSSFTFSVAPDFPCGTTILFDLYEIRSSNAPTQYADANGAFSVTVVNNFQPPIPTVLLNEDFDPAPPTGWTHELVAFSRFGCNVTQRDEWKVLQKDAAHGLSYHCGNGPGQSYNRNNHAWLYYGGKDSQNGPGIDVPNDGFEVLLEIVHWYDTQNTADGGQVAIDGNDDNQDTYQLIVPNGGYTGTLRTGFCNGIEGKEAFFGTSPGWITSTFDITAYRGKKIYLAFIFGSDNATSSDEGWYIDSVKVTSNLQGPPICHNTLWPGLVPGTTQLRKLGGGQLEASWSTACNNAQLPSQLYSLQAGDLDQLSSNGSYSHAPLSGDCVRTSPAAFTPAGGNQYYLVVSNQGGREASAGATSSGGLRPQVSAVCGSQRVQACP
jgi:hypothetical protein